MLIDTKTTTDQVTPPLLLWADHVVHFLPSNEEGVTALASVNHALQTYQKEKPDKKILLTPVVTRLPGEQEEEVRQYVTRRTLFHAERLSDDALPPDWKTWLAEHLYILSENRTLETQERFLLQGSHSDDNKWQLSHDYIHLFSHLAPPTEDELAAWQAKTPTDSDMEQGRAWWYAQVGISPLERVVDQVFHKHLHLGQILNVDDEPNIAFRVKTLHLMLETLIASLANATSGQAQASDKQALINGALRSAGRASGHDFGIELHDIYLKQAPEADFEERIEKWTKFDSGAGFGNIELAEYDERDKSGILLVRNSSFEHNPAIQRESRYELGQLFEGYMEEVIEQIVASIKENKQEMDRVKISTLPQEQYLELLKRKPGMKKDFVNTKPYQFQIISDNTSS